MANIPIVDKTGKEVGQYEIDTTELADKVTKQLLHDAVVMYRNNLRQGSVKTKPLQRQGHTQPRSRGTRP